MVTGRRSWRSIRSCGMAILRSRRMRAVESVGRADRGLADGIAKGVGQRMQGAPAGAMPGDDVFDLERAQSFNGLRNDGFHHTAEMQSPHDTVDRQVRKQLRHLRAYIDDARMRTGAEDDQSQMADVDHEHALV